jgi:hypothetical protein
MSENAEFGRRERKNAVIFWHSVCYYLRRLGIINKRM